MTTPTQQRRNRLKLADMLENRITDEQFDMSNYTNSCGTVGCALGIAVMSGEFGYGWNPICGGEPVKDGKWIWWPQAGADLFGTYAERTVLSNCNRRPRQTVAAELRGI